MVVGRTDGSRSSPARNASSDAEEGRSLNGHLALLALQRLCVRPLMLTALGAELTLPAWPPRSPRLAMPPKSSAKGGKGPVAGSSKSVPAPPPAVVFPAFSTKPHYNRRIETLLEDQVVVVHVRPCASSAYAATLVPSGARPTSSRHLSACRSAGAIG